MSATNYLANTPPDTEQIATWVEQFHRNGFLFFKNVLPPDLVAHLRADLDQRQVWWDRCRRAVARQRDSQWGRGLASVGRVPGPGRVPGVSRAPGVSRP